MISILLPAYNAQTTISSCLKSIQRQHFKAWRCVVVDDGSSDNTASIVREFQTMDTRFELIEAPHRGLVPTLQFGLQHCTAPFVARMDADDIMHSNRLKLQLAFLRQNEALAAVGCQVRIFPRESLKTGLRDYESWLNALCEPHELERDAYIECPVAHPSLLIRTEVLRAFGYRNQDWPEDYDLVLRLLLAGQKIANLPSRLLCWRNEPNRMSMTDPVCGIDRFVQCKAHFLCEGFLKKTDEYILWGYGRTGRMLSRELLSRGRRPSYIVEVHPGRLGNKIMGAPVISPEKLRQIPPKPIIVSVAKREPRGLVRNALSEMEFIELTDYVCAA